MEGGQPGHPPHPALGVEAVDQIPDLLGLPASLPHGLANQGHGPALLSADATQGRDVGLLVDGLQDAIEDGTDVHGALR